MSSTPAATERGHLRPLTSLRFIAASMIVLLHAQGMFGISRGIAEPFLLAQGVSFFFVLSGFILVYVYGELEQMGTRQFWRARFSRIWPAHVAALLLLLLLLPSARPTLDRDSIISLLANVSLLQSWTPTGEQWSSFNGVSWSVSTELGFYLLFPLLIVGWRRTWPWKLLGVLLLTLLLLALGNAGVFPMEQANAQGLANIMVLRVHPLARLFEFTLGMSAAVVWQRLAARRPAGFAAASLWEGAALLGLGVLMFNSAAWAGAAAQRDWVGSAGWVWLTNGGIPALGFAVLIVVLALGGGAVSRLLSAPLLVLLGEISYSSYLIHQILIRYAEANVQPLAALPSWLQLGLFVGLTLLLSYLCWALVETPCRALLTGRWQVRARVAAWQARRAGAGGAIPAPSRTQWRAQLPVALALVALVALASPVVYLTSVRPSLQAATPADAVAAMTVHVVDAEVRVLARLDGARDPARPWTDAGVVWQDRVIVPADDLARGAATR
ncbi:MAG: acyltransferase [Thermomicrobiales bacterium]